MLIRRLLWWASLVAQSIKNLSAVQETRVRSPSWEDPLEEEMATYSSNLAWKISWTEEPVGLQSMGSQRVRQDWATNTYLLTFDGSAVKNPPSNDRDVGSIPGSGRSAGEGNGNPLQYSRLGNPIVKGAWLATVPGLTKELDMTEQQNNNNNKMHIRVSVKAPTEKKTNRSRETERDTIENKRYVE